MDFTSKNDQKYAIYDMGVGSLAIILTLAIAIQTYYIRKKKVIIYAQPDFIALIFAGLLLVAGGAVLYSTEPSPETCVVREWLVAFGFSLELTPLIVKIAAINNLMQQAKKMKHAKLSRKRLFGIVGGVMCFIVIYLSVWTVLDPPSLKKHTVLTDRKTESGSVYIDVLGKCGSSSPYWSTVMLYFHGILITCGTVLAFQTRSMRQDFNESYVLAIMMYFRCIFLVLIVIVKQINEDVLDATMSLILSLDTITTLGVYFVPKILVARTDTLPTPNSTLGVSPRETLGNRCNHNASCTCFSNRNEVKHKTENQRVEEERMETIEEEKMEIK